MPHPTSFLASDFKNLNCFIFVWNVFVTCRLLCDLLESLWQTWHIYVCVCTRVCMMVHVHRTQTTIHFLRLIFTLCSHLCLRHPVNLFPSVFKLYLLLHHFHACSISTNLIFDLITNKFWWSSLLSSGLQHSAAYSWLKILPFESCLWTPTDWVTKKFVVEVAVIISGKYFVFHLFTVDTTCFTIKGNCGSQQPFRPKHVGLTVNKWKVVPYWLYWLIHRIIGTRQALFV